MCDQFGKVLFKAGNEQGVFTVDCDLGLREPSKVAGGSSATERRGRTPPSRSSRLGRNACFARIQDARRMEKARRDMAFVAEGPQHLPSRDLPKVESAYVRMVHALANTKKSG